MAWLDSAFCFCQAFFHAIDHRIFALCPPQIPSDISSQCPTNFPSHLPSWVPVLRLCDCHWQFQWAKRRNLDASFHSPVISDGVLQLSWNRQGFQTAKWQGIDSPTALIAKRQGIDNLTPKLEDSKELWKANRMEPLMGNWMEDHSMEDWMVHSTLKRLGINNLSPLAAKWLEICNLSSLTLCGNYQ